MRDDSRLTVAGADGCGALWMIVWGESPETAQLTMASLDAIARETAVVAIDAPIGLSDCGARRCDQAARQRLNAARRAAGPGRWVSGSSVFPPPIRWVIDCASWAQANALSRRLCGHGLSQQSWNIAPKIREAEALARRRGQEQVREAHPELAFLHLNGGRALPRKALPEGAAVRDDLLIGAGFRCLPGWLEAHSRRHRGDIRDAAVLWLTARRIAAKAADCLPPEPTTDATGLRMEIWV